MVRTFTSQTSHSSGHVATVLPVLTWNTATVVEEHQHEHHVTAPHRPLGWVLLFRETVKFVGSISAALHEVKLRGSSVSSETSHS
jgi:hypothetical protein